MSLYRMIAPGLPVEVLAADRATVEGPFTTLYGTALVIGRPHEVVVRRCPGQVLVELVDDQAVETSRAAWLV